MSSPLAWQGWIGSQIEHLRALDLLRTLKPLIPGQSAIEVGMLTAHPALDTLCCWQCLVFP